MSNVIASGDLAPKRPEASLEPRPAEAPASSAVETSRPMPIPAGHRAHPGLPRVASSA